MTKVYHFTDKNNMEQIPREGLKASSRYENFTGMRSNVVYCWLDPEHQKIFSGKNVCLEISIEEELCTVAEMDYISMAMMYKYGGAEYGGKNIPVNPEASELFVRLYEVTSLPLPQYQDNFFSPEVLVEGDIKPEQISIYEK